MSKPLLSTSSSRLALVLTLGLCLLALPLVETSRRQGRDLDAALAARRALEPLGRVVETQRALLAHQPRAAAVLAGRNEEEEDRQRLQARVDAEMLGLSASLEAQQLSRALDETDQLHAGWRALSLAIGQRQMEPAASDAAHALLVEQTYVVADLVAARTGLQGRLGPAGHTGTFADASEAALVLQALPRFEAALSRAAASTARAGRGERGAGNGAAKLPARDAETSPPLRDQARRIARAAAAVLADADAAAAAGAAPPPTPAEVRALIALRQAATRLAEPVSPTQPRAAREAERQLRSAQAAGDEASRVLHARLAAGAARAVDALRFERMLVGAALGLLLLLCASTAWRVVPRNEAPDDTGSPDQPAAPLGAVSPPAESEGPASDLLRRLRESVGDRLPAATSSRPEPPR